MRVDDFDFELPEALIALRPARPRDAARLLQVGAPSRGRPGAGLHDGYFRDILGHLRAGDVLVVNETRVMPAHLTGRRAARAQGGGGDVTIGVNLHKRLSARAGEQIWAVFARPAKRLRVQDEIDFGSGFTARIHAHRGAEVELAFPLAEAAFIAALNAHGAPPLPPYIGRRRDVDEADITDYQTVFADVPGSVAAPTAGLHFTPSLLQEIRDKGVLIEPVTLHVGAGTFLPVQGNDTDDHHMHGEWGEVPAGTAQRLTAVKQAGGRIIAVGTTSLRLLETAACAGGEIGPFCGETDIFITPGFDFRAVDALITNFHLPRSTLFMLVCAFAGYDRMVEAYRHAIAAKYRFCSYGDACYLLRHDR